MGQLTAMGYPDWTLLPGASRGDCPFVGGPNKLPPLMWVGMAQSIDGLTVTRWRKEETLLWWAGSSHVICSCPQTGIHIIDSRNSLALQSQMVHHGASQPSYLCEPVPHNQSLPASLSKYAYSSPLVKGRIAVETHIFHPLPQKGLQKMVYTRQDWRPQSVFFLPQHPTPPASACSPQWACSSELRG